MEPLSAAPAAVPPEPRSGINQSARPRVTPGKLAMWLFLATEIMFFTGLIGSYIVLRAGSPPATYSNLFPPGSPRTADTEAQGLRITARENAEAVALAVYPLFQLHTPLPVDDIKHRLEEGELLTPGTDPRNAAALASQVMALGGRVEMEPLRVSNWPRPYDASTNPLSIDLTAINTFILICSSVTMVMALSAIQRGQRWRCSLYLLATLLIGGTFLGIQMYEYRQLMFGHTYPIGISPTGHFRPNVSLFASCFFVMTGFHGAHVAGGLITLFFIWLRATFGGYSRAHHSPVELAGLYWHFVDLVWIILFTVVYLI